MKITLFVDDEDSPDDRFDDDTASVEARTNTRAAGRDLTLSTQRLGELVQAPRAGEMVGEPEELTPANELAVRWLLGYKASTAKTYGVMLRLYLAECDKVGVDPLAVTPEFVTAYEQQLRDRAGDKENDPAAWKTVQARIGVVRGFYAFAVEVGVLQNSPALLPGRTVRPPAPLLAPLKISRKAVKAQEAAEHFLLTHTSNTRRAYEGALRDYFTACFRFDVDPFKARRQHVEAWRELLRERGLSVTSMNAKLVAVRSFYRYCVEERLITNSPATQVKPQKVADVPKSTGLSREELLAFLKMAEAYGPTQYAAMCLLGLNGLRASEVASVRMEGIVPIRGHRVVHVVRKGFTDYTPVPVSPQVAEAIDRLIPLRNANLTEAHRALGWHEHAGPLFLTSRGVALQRQNLYHWVRRISQHALPHRPPIHPHELRHAFVTLSLDAGVSLRDVQDAAGHTSANTTRRYDRARYSLDRHATYRLAGYLGEVDRTTDDTGAPGAAGPRRRPGVDEHLEDVVDAVLVDEDQDEENDEGYPERTEWEGR